MHEAGKNRNRKKISPNFIGMYNLYGSKWNKIWNQAAAVTENVKYVFIRSNRTHEWHEIIKMGN